MASPATAVLSHQAQLGEENSDYGSEFSPEEEEIIARLLLVGAESTEEIEDNPIITGVENHEPVQAVRLPRVLAQGSASQTLGGGKATLNGIVSTIKGVESGGRYTDNEKSLSNSNKVTLDVQSPGEEKLDMRSPVERFRTAPKKSLSVTDLVSPAWCELQYWYTLKIHGRKKPTPEMKRGSIVHKKLEDEIYKTVKVEIKTKEDAWGLRIWNVIQGLRTLEEIGHTRELEVWGVIDGLPVNGVIDEVSFICPDTELEAELHKSNTSSKEEIPPDQTTLNDFFQALGSTSIAAAARPKRRSASNKIYICDVKTRSVHTLPKGAAFRPTKMQLMLYHHLLGNLATNQVDFSVLLGRYNLDGDTPFSDSFIAQIGSLNDEISYPSGSNGTEATSTQSSQDSMSMLLGHNSLSQLWSLMIASFQRVLPHGRDSIGNLLRAEYRSRDQGEILGSTTLAMDEDVLKLYLEHEMKWWKGEREPMGVVIEEAYKCKSCEFAEICDWRLVRVEEAREKSRANKKAITEIKKWDV